MHSGDEYYGDDVTSPLSRPMPATIRAGFQVGDRVAIGMSTRKGTVTAVGYRDVYVRTDDNGAEKAYQPQYVRKITG